MEDFFKLVVAVFAGGAGIWWLIRSSFGAFLEEKGKNIVTKQDIGEITKIVESIRHENNLILEERGRAGPGYHRHGNFPGENHGHQGF